MHAPALILASASPRRSDLLHHLGYEFEVLPAEVHEAGLEHLSPHELCQLLAYRKARSVAKRTPDSVVLGADTVVCLGGSVYGKPADLGAARRILEELQGRTHEVVTGVCLLHLRRHRQQLFAVGTSVTFRPLNSRQIDRYLEKVNPLDKAGAYAIQEKGEWIIESVDGSFSNVVGLPVEHVQAALRGMGLG